jgi:aryl-alcohol dehydrogenase-like predicted oxidoreductase
MRYRLLGGNGLRVSEVSLGAMTFAERFRPPIATYATHSTHGVRIEHCTFARRTRNRRPRALSKCASGADRSAVA